MGTCAGTTNRMPSVKADVDIVVATQPGTYVPGYVMYTTVVVSAGHVAE
jgi:hypothetical protein